METIRSGFPSNPPIIRVRFFLIFSFNEGTPKETGKKTTTGVPRDVLLTVWGLRWN